MPYTAADAESLHVEHRTRELHVDRDARDRATLLAASSVAFVRGATHLVDELDRLRARIGTEGK